MLESVGIFPTNSKECQDLFELDIILGNLKLNKKTPFDFLILCVK